MFLLKRPGAKRQGQVPCEKGESDLQFLLAFQAEKQTRTASAAHIPRPNSVLEKNLTLSAHVCLKMVGPRVVPLLPF